MVDEMWYCPKCKSPSGDNWSCDGDCPLEMSPDYNVETAKQYDYPIPYVTDMKG